MVASLVLAAVSIGAATRSLRAADHMEAPGTRADLVADIADVYAWHDANAGTLTAIITFDGIKAPEQGQSGSFDKRALYTLNIDNDGDNSADVSVRVRFGRNSAGEWGMRVEGLPGASASFEGAVEAVLTGGVNARAFAGLFDDPFFFDLDGFNQTVSSGNLSFDSMRDSFAGSNTTAIVLEMDLAAATAGSETIQVWATTARKGG